MSFIPKRDDFDYEGYKCKRRIQDPRNIEDGALCDASIGLKAVN